jgi:Domain of unknown function (DUF4352)
LTSQYAPTPPAPPAPEVEKRKPIYLRWWFIALTVLLLIIVISGLSGDGDEATTASEPVAEEPEAPAAEVAPAEEEAAPPEEQAPEPEAAPAAGIGTPVRDGQFEFVVTGIENVGTEIGDPQFMSETAQGEYLIVRVDITNIGDEPRMFDASTQYLYDAESSRYDASSDAYLLDDFDKAFLEEINPGNTVTAAPLLYDVPSGFVPASIELHDSLLSGGVTVTLQ